MRISDWSSDVCSSDLRSLRYPPISPDPAQGRDAADRPRARGRRLGEDAGRISRRRWAPAQQGGMTMEWALLPIRRYSEFSGRSRRKEFWSFHLRSEEHTSELQSLMRISYAVFCLKKKNKTHTYKNTKITQSQNH